ncbi:MAG TPA: ferredoxin [Candidatus Methylomirabilis sp.]|nr:ferredoxin [Candidatus Methylomirabilis sp.]
MIGTPVQEGSAHRTGKAVIRVREDWCKGCEICVRVCQKKCLAMNGRGKVAVVNLEACNRCLLCDLLCPDFAIVVE